MDELRDLLKNALNLIDVYDKEQEKEIPIKLINWVNSYVRQWEQDAVLMKDCPEKRILVRNAKDMRACIESAWGLTNPSIREIVLENSNLMERVEAEQFKSGRLVEEIDRIATMGKIAMAVKEQRDEA